MKPKKCPLKVSGYYTNKDDVDCTEEKCAWWIKNKADGECVARKFPLTLKENHRVRDWFKAKARQEEEK